MCWSAFLVRNRPKAPPEPVRLPGGPFAHYYAQESCDEGIIMETDLTVKEVNLLINSCYPDQLDWFA